MGTKTCVKDCLYVSGPDSFKITRVFIRLKLQFLYYIYNTNASPALCNVKKTAIIRLDDDTL